MSTTRTRVARNVSVMMGAQAITWMTAPILAVVLPRYLGPVDAGKLYLAISIWGIVSIFVSFGSGVLLTKEIAREPGRLSNLLGVVVAMRVALYVVALAALIGYVWIAGYPIETVYVILIVGVPQLLFQFLSAAQSALEGLERMEFISLGNVVAKIIELVLVVSLLVLGQGVYAIAAVGAVSCAVQTAVLWRALRGLQRFTIDFGMAKAGVVLRASLPYMFSMAVFAMYQQCDIVVISLVADEATIGWYASAVRLAGTFLFIPTIFMTAVFPVFARLHSIDSDSVPELFRRSFRLLVLASVPIGLGAFVTAEPLVALLFGPAFAGSAPVLGIMGIVLIMLFQNVLIGRFLISIDRQNTWTMVMAIGVVATIALDLLLIPWCRDHLQNGAIGGALSYLVTELGMTAAGIVLLPRGCLDRSSATLALRALLAGALMAVVAWAFRGAFIAVPIAAGAVTYIALIAVMRLVPRDEIDMTVEMLRSLLGRVRQERPRASEVG